MFQFLSLPEMSTKKNVFTQSLYEKESEQRNETFLSFGRNLVFLSYLWLEIV